MRLETMRKQHTQYQHQPSRFRTLVHWQQRIAASLQLPEVLHAVTHAAITLLDAPLTVCWLVHETSHTLEAAALPDEEVDIFLPSRTLRFDQEGEGWVATHRRPLNIPDIYADERFLAHTWWQEQKLCSFLALPVVSDDALLAVLALYGRQPFRDQCEDGELLEVLLAQAATAIRNALLHSTVVAAHSSAEASKQAQSTFLAHISHELRTSMNGIMGMIALALETTLTDAQHDYLTVVASSAASMLQVLNSLLDFSKIAPGNVAGEVLPFSLRDSVNKALQRPIDVTLALVSAAGQPHLLQELAQTFLEHTPRQLEELRLALRARDVQRIQRAAHTLRNSVGTFGAQAGYNLANALEAMGRNGNLQDANPALHALEREIDKIMVFLSTPGWEKSA